MAEIREVVSESLQATIRRLLPSQRGFTEDLQATNVITPIIDLTPTAEGSVLPIELQTAFGFDDVTAFLQTTGETEIITNTGFYRCFGMFNTQGAASSSAAGGGFRLKEGATQKILTQATQINALSQAEFFHVPFDFNVFLRAGQALVCFADNGCSIRGVTRQIADVNGNLVNPSGFTSA